MSAMNRRALKRMPLDKLMDLKVDYAFKQLFGSEKNKDITVVFLNAILQKTGRNTIKEVVFINQEVGGEYLDDKQSRLDIVVRTQANELINVEMQLSNQHDMIKRTLYYWSRLFLDQLPKGKTYRRLLPTITINICDFTLFSKSANYHSTYHLYEDSSLERLDAQDDVLEIHFIEMKKFIQAWHEDKVNPLDDVLVRWLLLLLGMVDARKQRVYDEIYEELEELAMKDERLLEAFTAWEELSQTPETVIAYHSRLKAIEDHELSILHAKEEGIEEGIEVGKAEGIEEGKKETIRNGYENGVDVTTLALVTGYSEEKVKAIITSFKQGKA